MFPRSPAFPRISEGSGCGVLALARRILPARWNIVSEWEGRITGCMSSWRNNLHLGRNSSRKSDRDLRRQEGDFQSVNKLVVGVYC